LLLNNPLDEILGQVSKIRISRFLVNSQAQLNGREIAKNVGLSHVTVHTALKDLSRHGIVNIRSVGKSLIYWLNEEHLLVKEVLRPIFEKESIFFQLIVKTILKESKRPRPLTIILFGSFAKGNASPNSDIDILLVYPNHKSRVLITKELAEAEKKITLLFGNHLASIFMKIAEFKSRFKKKDRFIKEIAGTGKIIFGKGIGELASYETKRHQNHQYP